MIRTKVVSAAVLGTFLVVFWAAVSWRRPELKRSTAVQRSVYEIRTANGVPLASLFEGVSEFKLPPAVLRRLRQTPQALAGHVGCPYPSSRPKLSSLFSADSVFAQSNCDSCNDHDCVGHYNDTQSVYLPFCGTIYLCTGGTQWMWGCEGVWYGCTDGGCLCGQAICDNE